MKKIFFVLVLLPSLVMAEITPANHPYDPRVRLVDYNPLDVVKVSTFFGVSTMVQFAKGESIKEIAMGDEGAWSIVPRGDHFFIRPKETKADTNVTVLTDKRVYHFSLFVASRSLKDASAWRDPNLVYSLTFRYPDEERKLEEDEARQRQQKALADAALAERKANKAELKNKLQMATKLDRSGEKPMERGNAPEAKKMGETSYPYPLETPDNEMNHFDYWVAGSELISPTGARDDGRFTYLLFSNNRDMPAVYMVDEAGKESLINTHVEGNTIVVHHVVPRLTLRRGDAVACVLNKGFDLGGYNDRSGTVSSDVKRTVREIE